uniref:Uncharacterized protein n=1 Tax=Trichuris muris TaxID=70415 RepID=A0A5S6Q5L8_TRIMR
MQLTWLLILCLAVAGTVGKKDSSGESDSKEVKLRHSHGKASRRAVREAIAREKRAETEYHVRGRIYQPERVQVKANIGQRPTLSPERAREIEEKARQMHGQAKRWLSMR